MGINTGYLKAKSTLDSDEMYTPYYGAKPIAKYIDSSLKVWCPFDKVWSAYVRVLQENGNDVIYSHIDEGKDFFEYEPEEYDIIISNPPFSKKDRVLKRLDELGKPFAILLPVNSIQGKKRFEYFKNGIQMLVFDERIGFHNAESMSRTVEGSPFASAYFCRGVLPKDLIVERLEKMKKSLN